MNGGCGSRLKLASPSGWRGSRAGWLHCFILITAEIWRLNTGNVKSHCCPFPATMLRNKASLQRRLEHSTSWTWDLSSQHALHTDGLTEEALLDEAVKLPSFLLLAQHPVRRDYLHPLHSSTEAELSRILRGCDLGGSADGGLSGWWEKERVFTSQQIAVLTQRIETANVSGDKWLSERINVE